MPSEGLHTPSPSSSTQPAASSTRPSAKVPSSLSEWQLMAVLHRANLLQYFDTFIAQGGDDVNQIMQCDEQEFLEIMSLVGMLSKPLHVRRLQRTLTEFSKDPTSFNLAAIQQIGAPPASAFPVADPMQLFLPSLNGVPSSSPGLLISSSSSPSHRLSEVPPLPSLPLALSSIGGTANVVAGDFLAGLGMDKLPLSSSHSAPCTSSSSLGQVSSSPVTSPQHDDFVSLGDFDPIADVDGASGETPVLSDAQLRRLTQRAQLTVQRLPHCKPKLVQNKKKISKELLDLMTMPISDPRRLEEYRKYAAIYGRFDAKRKADKALTLHEVSVNEAAAQICLIVPALLTRRDELFTLARQVVKDAGYHYVKSASSSGLKKEESSSCSSAAVAAVAASLSTVRKRNATDIGRDSISPSSNNSTSPLATAEESSFAEEASQRGKRSRLEEPKAFTLEKWAAERLGQGSSSNQ